MSVKMASRRRFRVLCGMVLGGEGEGLCWTLLVQVLGRTVTPTQVRPVTLRVGLRVEIQQHVAEG